MNKTIFLTILSLMLYCSTLHDDRI